LILTNALVTNLDLDKKQSHKSIASFTVGDGDSTIVLKDVHILIPNIKNVDLDAVVDNNVEKTQWDIPVPKLKNEYLPTFTIRFKSHEQTKLNYLLFPLYTFFKAKTLSSDYYNSAIATQTIDIQVP
jgi:hypothetical protein